MSVYSVPTDGTPLAQGDIFKNVPYWRPHRKTKNDPWPSVTQRGIVLDLQTSSYAILATQTCDLPKAKELLFVTAAIADEVADKLATNAEHPLSTDEFRNWVVKNLHIRFHFFEGYKENDRVIIPELVANFRSPFTLRADYVKERLLPDRHRVLCLREMYSAEFGNRFGQYFSRVATDRNMESI